MEIPTGERELALFTSDLVEECLISRENRRMAGRRWRSLYYSGSMTSQPSKHNRCYNHVDKLSSFLFSPSDVHFTVEFEGDALDEWRNKKTRASRYMNNNFNKSACGSAFGQANEIALVEGSCIIKLTWNAPRQRMEPHVIAPSFFGVFREDIADLDRQEAFVHSFYVTRAIFKRMIWKHADRDEIMQAIRGSASVRSSEELTGDSYFHEIITGGQIPYAGQPGGSTPTQYGTVNWSTPTTPQLAPEVAANLIRVDDLWVWNDMTEDWATIRYVDPGILVEGRYRLTNMSDAPKRHPFIKVCSNEIHNYFWGRSELAAVLENQMLLNARVDDIDSIFRLQAKPPRSFSGFQGITEEKARTLLAAGGTVTDGATGAKVENLAPEMPAMSMDYLDRLDAYFDESAGFTNILSGQGEPGVRAGVHAGVLLRTSTPRLRDRALIVERQAAQVGTLYLDISRAKDGKILMTRPGPDGKHEEFLLEQLPKDANVSVDSHTSSPAFSEDNRQTAFALAKAEAIDPQTLIEMIHPPREEELIERLNSRQEAQAQALAANPQLADAGKKK